MVGCFQEIVPSGQPDCLKQLHEKETRELCGCCVVAQQCKKLGGFHYA